MRKIILYIAASLNGKIARKDGSVDWLESIPNPNNDDYGYSQFYQSIDTTIQGYATYKQVIDWEIKFPYAEKKNYVLTTKQNLNNTEYVEFISKNPLRFLKELKERKGLDIWLIGGGKANTLLLNEGLIDEIRIFLMPIILSDGIDVFETFPKETQLKLVHTISYSSGAVELNYRIEKDAIFSK